MRKFLAQVALFAILVVSVFGNTTVSFAEEAAISLSEAAGITTPSQIQAYFDMRDYYETAGCEYDAVSQKIPFWNMLAVNALLLTAQTNAPYDSMYFKTMDVQTLATTMIAMVSDGVDPSDYEVDGIDLVQYLYLCMDAEGGFVNPNSTYDMTGCYVQPYPIIALYLCGVDVPQEAADWFASCQDENGIAGYSWGGTFYTDPDSTCWAISACHLAGIDYPNEEKALKKLAASLKNTANSNTYACYLDMLVTLGEAADKDVKYMVDNFYNKTQKKFTYGGAVNELATVQCSVALGDYMNGCSVYELLSGSCTYGAEIESSEILVRIADCQSKAVTKDLVERTELTVTAGASSVLTGIKPEDLGPEVDVLDALTEAVCYGKTGKDPTYHDLVANREYINEKLIIAYDPTYGIGISGLYGYDDGSFGYYTDREHSCWSLLDPVKDCDDLFLFHYDYMKASYAVFDALKYTAESNETVKVQVKAVSGYDLSYNPIYSGIAASVKAQKGDAVKTFQCGEDGFAQVSGLSAGTWKLTASFGTESAYIVSPFATAVIGQAEEPTPEPSPVPSYSGSYSSYVPQKPVKTGTWNDPVTDGTWKQNADGSWTYTTNAMFRSTWGYISNPYAKGTEKNQWFYFDENGKMLTGWQVIGGKWYYLNTASDGSLGACLLNTTTPDGYTVNENGEWTVNGVVQTVGSVSTASGTVTAASSGTVQTDSSGTVSASSSGTAASSGEQPKTGNVSVSISANVKTTDDRQVSFSGSKTIRLEEGESVSAYDVLEALCADKGYAIEGSSAYVSAVNGLGEFDAGPTSGWMYSVNGKYPNVSAGEYEAKAGDKIRWVYVTKFTDVTADF